MPEEQQCPLCSRYVDHYVVQGSDVPWTWFQDADGRYWHVDCASRVLSTWRNAMEQLRLHHPQLRVVPMSSSSPVNNPVENPSDRCGQPVVQPVNSLCAKTVDSFGTVRGFSDSLVCKRSTSYENTTLLERGGVEGGTSCGATASAPKTAADGASIASSPLGGQLDLIPGLPTPEPKPKRFTLTPTLKANLAAIYDGYPRKEGKKAGLASLERQLRDATDRAGFLARVERAVANYSRLCRRENREATKIKHFSTFANNWTDYDDPVKNPLPQSPKPVQDLPVQVNPVERKEARAIVAELASRLQYRPGGGK